eukprot:s3533_g4.t2
MSVELLLASARRRLGWIACLAHGSFAAWADCVRRLTPWLPPHADGGPELQSSTRYVRGSSSLSEAELVPGDGRSQADPRIYRPMTETVRTYLNPAHFFMLLRAHGTSFFAGVPDSLLKDRSCLIADSVGRYKTIIGAGAIYATGTLCVAVAVVHAFQTSLGWMFTGGCLLLIAAGTGGIMPNIANFGADQIGDETESQRECQKTYFSLFYLAINTGVLFAFGFFTNITTGGLPGVVSQSEGYSFAYGAGAVFMIAAVLIFISFTGSYRRLPGNGLGPVKRLVRYQCRSLRGGGWRAAMSAIGWLCLPFFYLVTLAAVLTPPAKSAGEEVANLNTQWVKELNDEAKDDFGVEDARATFGALPMIVIVNIAFNLCYNSINNAFPSQACQMDLRIGSMQLNGAFFNIADASAILVFTPLFESCLYPVIARMKGSPVQLGQKIVAGLLVACSSNLVAASLEMRRRDAPYLCDAEFSQCAPGYTEDGLHGTRMKDISAFWIFMPFTLVGIAEILVNPCMLQYSYEAAPMQVRSLLQAINLFFQGSVSNAFTSVVTKLTYPNDLDSGHLEYYYYLNAALAVGGILLYFAVTRRCCHGKGVRDAIKKEEVIAANEGTALAMAAGHYLATGSIACVYLQNSGLGNTINPLLSLLGVLLVYAIPALLLIGWRGEPGKKDEPQHLLQGALTPTMLENMGVPFEILPDYAEGPTKEPFALLVKKETFEKYRLATPSSVFGGDDMLHREEPSSESSRVQAMQCFCDLAAQEILEETRTAFFVLLVALWGWHFLLLGCPREIIQIFPASPLVTTTGFTSREMFELRVQKGQSHGHDFLTVGSMGHCSSIALGVALARPQQEVLCIDGDGAALMHMGCFATIGKCGLGNFKHVLINNAVHDSVGGSASIDFPSIAKACGYKEVLRACSTAEVKEALVKLKASVGPAFLEIQALPGARADLGRPTTRLVETGDGDKSLERAAEQLQERCQWMGDSVSSAALEVAVSNFRSACPEPRPNCLHVLPSLVRQQRRARQMCRAIEALTSQNVLDFLQATLVSIKALRDLLVECSTTMAQLADRDWSEEERECVQSSDEMPEFLLGLSALRRLLWRLGLAAELFMSDSSGEVPAGSPDAKALQELQSDMASNLAAAKASWAKLESDVLGLRLKLEPWAEATCFEAGGSTADSNTDLLRTAPLCPFCLLPCVPLALEAEVSSLDPGAASVPWRGGHWHVQCANFWLRHGRTSEAFKASGMDDPFKAFALAFSSPSRLSSLA